MERNINWNEVEQYLKQYVGKGKKSIEMYQEIDLDKIDIGEEIIAN